MKREEIENILKQNDSSVLSFKDRGPWGDNKYRGNIKFRALHHLDVWSERTAVTRRYPSRYRSYEYPKRLSGKASLG